MSADGSRVFLETDESLVPADINGVGDVYEWEQEGTTACPAATSIYGGCVFLLSGGQNATPSTFIDASADGGDVFFTSRAQLVPQDRDEKNSLYDAHECTPATPCGHESSTACAGTGCQGVPPAPPAFATPSSATFSGVGNFPPPGPAKPAVKPKAPTRAQKLAKALRACKKHKVRKRRLTCQKQAHKKYGAAKAGNANRTAGIKRRTSR
jgi:hypothetical protein